MTKEDYGREELSNNLEIKKRSLHVRQFYGPIPPAEEIREWDEILPGSADRVLKMAEKEQRHRHEQEKRIVSYEYQWKKRGQLIGAIIGIIGMGGGIVLSYLGKDISGLGALISTLAGLVYVYVSSQKKSKEAVEEQSSKQSEEVISPPPDTE